VRDPYFYVNGLLDLDQTEEGPERRSLWRQSITALSRASQQPGPGPLEGLEPNAVARGVKAALASGLVDDLEWLAPVASGLALYVLAAALPLGNEQRELGRRLLSRLHAGNAETFAALAGKMALSSAKSIATPAARARIALLTELPLGLGVSDGPVAYAIVSRKELCRDWIDRGASSSLPMRRLAARLLERATREALRRAQGGDPHAFRCFQMDPAKGAWSRLLADRESLVWRHAAVAQGIAAKYTEGGVDAILEGLNPQHSPTEWRRAATALAALSAVEPDLVLRTLVQVDELQKRDSGIGSAVIWGLPRAAETEPDVAEAIFERIADSSLGSIADAVYDARFEFGGMGFGGRIAARYLALAAGRRGDQIPRSERDQFAAFLNREVLRDLDVKPRSDEPLRFEVERALLVFHEVGAPAAYAEARTTLDAAVNACATLERLTRDVGEGNVEVTARTALILVRDLDLGLLEQNTLSDLLKLGTSPIEQRTLDESTDQLRERLADWLSQEDEREPALLGTRKLRALLHVADSDIGEGDDSARNQKQRIRWARIARTLLGRAERTKQKTPSLASLFPAGQSGGSLRPAANMRDDATVRDLTALYEEGDRVTLQEPLILPKTSRRALLAALGRSLDALVRIEAIDETDVFLILSFGLDDPEDFEALADASMDPELEEVLTSYVAFLRATAERPVVRERRDSLMPSLAPPPVTQTAGQRSLDALLNFAGSLVSASTSRAEALRATLTRLNQALSSVASASNLRALSPTDSTEPDPLSKLGHALSALGQMVSSARARLALQVDPQGLAPDGEALVSLITRLFREDAATVDAASRDRMIGENLTPALGRIPSGMRPLIATIARRMAGLEAGQVIVVAPAPVRRLSAELPAWTPPRRTLGGFYLLRPLGSGGAGSVFLVTRIEDRHDPKAERFALKVPDYSATAARSLSEAEFLNLFREEGTALLAMPTHPNLAKFETFDLGAKPKPILVMEFVEGLTLDREIESRTLTIGRAFGILEDVLSGLSAMHSVGVGHFDVKPSNVVLRDGKQGVLVDFGLAGRRFRPGCATGPYGAPEVWAEDREVSGTPHAADVYAFGCLAYEVLTGKVLFDAPTEFAMIARHIAHDGFPPGVEEMAKDKTLAPLGELLFSTLRRHPAARITIDDLRGDLLRIGKRFWGMPWPLAPAVSVGGR
jgi:eukaryotic-like serine/threonine-protein kinase